MFQNRGEGVEVERLARPGLKLFRAEMVCVVGGLEAI